MNSTTYTSSFKGATAPTTASLPGLVVACALLLFIGCSAGVPKPGAENPNGPTPPPSTPDPADITVALSSLTPDPSQGKVLIVDYEGPEFDQEHLRIALGEDPVEGLFFDEQIGLLLPLSHEGQTTLSFYFGVGKSASLELNIVPAPDILNPKQYVSDELSRLIVKLSELVESNSAYRGAHDAAVDLQSSLDDLGDATMNEVAVFIKQNIEPSTDRDPTISMASLLAVTETTKDKCKKALRELNTYIEKTPVRAIIAGSTPANLLGVISFLGDYTPRGIKLYDDAIKACAALKAEQSPPITHTDNGVRLVQTASLLRIEFSDGFVQEITVTATYKADPDIENAVSQLRIWTTRMRNLASSQFPDRFESSFDATLARLQKPEDRTEAVDAIGFTLEGTSDRNITGEIVSAVGTTLTVRFSFSDQSAVQGEYVDFNFILANDDAGLEDASVPGRLYAMGEYLYWNESIAILRANLDGSEIVRVLPRSYSDLGSITITSIAIDSGKIYWIQSDSVGSGSGEIRRADLDGSNIEILVTGISDPEDIDIYNGKIYWTERSLHDSYARTRRANLDGSGIVAIKNDDDRYCEIGRFDLPYSGAIFHCTYLDDDINIDGDKIYWGAYQRANLDGSQRETQLFYNTLGATKSWWWGHGTKLEYWLEHEDSDVDSRCGSRETAEKEDSPWSIVGDCLSGVRIDYEDHWYDYGAADFGGGKMYWIESSYSSPDDDRIRSRDLNSGDVRTLVSGFEALGDGIVVHKGKMYWVEVGRRIRRADVDGTDVEDVVLGHTPFEIAIATQE